MLTELGKWFLNLALATAVTVILKPLLEQNANFLAMLIGFSAVLIFVFLGCFLIKKGENNGGF